MSLISERLLAAILCLCPLASCARRAVDDLTDAGGSSGSNIERDASGNSKDDLDGMTPMRDAGKSVGNDSGSNTGKGSGTGKDSGMSMSDAAPSQCNNPALTCQGATLLGEIDASDSSATLTRQGKGSGWFGIDLKDGDKLAQSNTQIGVRVKLAVPAGSMYSITLMGDTSPSGGGRCISANVTDTDPLEKTAIWGSFGPATSKNRSLAVHVQHVSGPCDAEWTLTMTGNPCTASFGFGENSLGSCP